MSYTVHRLILSYGLFIVSGCDLVCGVLCTWRGLCLIMWSDRTNCYIRLSGTHWENPSEWKRGCGAIWWFDMWYSAKSGILFDCRAYYWVVQNVIPDWSRFPKWECGRAVWCVGGCGSMGGLIDYVGLWDLYCDLLWHDNGIWFLSAVGCMVIWFVVIWADIVQSGLYLGKLWECLFLCLPVLKLCRTLFPDICCWSCMVLWLCGYWACVRCCRYIIVF